MSVKDNLTTIQKLINDYEKKYHREPNSVALLAVSKLQSVTKMQEAYAAGQAAFGESYIQEALPKLELFTSDPIEWHFIGHIQSNKTKKIAENFAWVHSIDNMKIVKRLSEQRPLHLPPLNICIEVNVSHEVAKSGIELQDLLPLAQYCLTLPQIHLRGLMTIPAEEPDINKQREAFRILAKAYHSLREKGISLDTLSMGMSEDFEAAIAEGSTMVRIGTGIFGPREER